jgi:DNA-binding NarL/FixJ family response regulator
MRILVAHRAPSVAEGMASALRQELDVDAIISSSSPLAGHLDGEQPDIAVIDVELASDRAAHVCRRLADDGVKSVMLVGPAGANHLELLEHGAAGLAVTTDGLPGVFDAVRTVMAGHVHIPAHLLGAVLHELIVERRNTQPAVDRVASLSPREREVLALLGAGAGTQEIAGRLVISPYTAKTHINRLLGKLGLASRTEAAAFALDHDIRSHLLEVTGD